jgi:predicted ribonuclease YlaK
MPKTYFLDTNVLLHDPEALFAFQEKFKILVKMPSTFCHLKLGSLDGNA